ncbi:MAG: response regulator [Chloroflexota bacterium]
MIDRSQLEKYTHDALAHLYDLPYLRGHPLAHQLSRLGGTEESGRVLRRALLDAIQELKPPPDSPSDSAALARYQFLYLRYIQGRSMDEIAKQLSLGERQLYRRQHDALGVVATALARALRIPQTGSDLAVVDDGGAPRDETLAGESALNGNTRSEIDRIGTARAADPTDLVQLLQGVVATVAHLTDASGIAISVSLGSALRPIAADRVAVRQAILGLLTFAIESSSRSEIRIAIEAAGRETQLSVRLSPKPGLTGAGLVDDDSNLAVCRRLIELQGGSVRWQMVDRGLAVVVSLPVAGPRSVLIVDDNADTLQLFNRYLANRGHRALTASTGEEALRVVAVERPDALILDVMLPSADGYEALQSLRADPETSEVPVVVCTVLKQRDLAMSLGATEFVPKPTTQGDLLAALERCWAPARSGRPRSA